MLKLIEDYSWSTTLGNALLIILIAYIVADVLSNKRMSAPQLVGKLILSIFLMFLLFMRGGNSYG